MYHLGKSWIQFSSMYPYEYAYTYYKPWDSGKESDGNEGCPNHNNNDDNDDSDKILMKSLVI